MFGLFRKPQSAERPIAPPLFAGLPAEVQEAAIEGIRAQIKTLHEEIRTYETRANDHKFKADNHERSAETHRGHQHTNDAKAHGIKEQRDALVKTLTNMGQKL